MTTLSYTFDGGTDEATITTSDTGSGTAWDTVNVPAQGGSPSVGQAVYDTAYTANGAAGGRFRSTDAGGAFVVWDASLGSATVSYARLYATRPTTIGATRTLMQFRDATPTTIASVRLTTAGKIALHDAAGTARYTSTKSFSSAEELRLEVHVDHDATNGHMEARLFYGANLNGTTADEVMGNTSDNWNTGALVDNVRIGQITAAAAGTNEVLPIDEIEWNNVDWAGPVTGAGGGTIADLTEPDTTGYTVLNDPNPAAVWTPTFSPGVNYVLKGPGGVTPWTRTRRILLRPNGGRVVIDGVTINISFVGTEGHRILHIEGTNQNGGEIWVIDSFLRNPAQLETDGIQTQDASGGNIDTGAGGIDLYLVRTRIDGLQGSDAGVHADGLQLAGGLRKFHAQDVTIQSSYVPLQLQREQAVTGTARNVTSLTKSGSTGVVTVNTGLDIAPGDWVQFPGSDGAANFAPTNWHGTYKVLTITNGTAPNVTGFTVDLGDAAQTTPVTTLSTCCKSRWQYYVGEMILNRVNFRRADNINTPPTQTLTHIRGPWGRPDRKTESAEDRSPLIAEGGTIAMQDVWGELNSGEDLADMMEPSDASTVYSVARGFLDTTPTPDEWSWPDNPRATGVVVTGVPGGGDYAPAPGAGITAAIGGAIPAFTGAIAATPVITAAIGGSIAAFTGTIAADAGATAPAGPVIVQTVPSELTTVAWTIDGHPVALADATYSDGPGGFDQMRGVMAAADWLKAEGYGADQNSRVLGLSDGVAIWAGRLSARPLIDSAGHATLAAQGERYAAVKHQARLFVQAIGAEGWTPTDSEPHVNANGSSVYPSAKRVDVSIDGSRVRLAVARDLALVAGARSGVVFYAEGVDIGRLSWIASYQAGDETGSLKIQPFRATGPTGGLTEIGAGRPTNSGNNGTRVTETFSANPDDLVGLLLEVVTAHTPSDAGVYRLLGLRVNSTVTLEDEMTGAELISYVGTVMGWDTSGVRASQLNILPFDHVGGDWLAAALYVATLEDRAFRVGADPTGQPTAEYARWGARSWDTAQQQGASAEMNALERYDAVRVTYQAVSGRTREVTRTSDEYPSLGNTYDLTLADPQEGSTLAAAVAETLLAHYSAQRYAGTITVPVARSSDGLTDVRRIRYGDTLTLTDLGPGRSMGGRVVAVDGSAGAPRVTIEQPMSALAVEAAARIDLMKRGNR